MQEKVRAAAGVGGVTPGAHLPGTRGWSIGTERTLTFFTCVTSLGGWSPTGLSVACTWFRNGAVGPGHHASRIRPLTRQTSAKG
jgi:hypothetical protein